MQEMKPCNTCKHWSKLGHTSPELGKCLVADKFGESAEWNEDFSVLAIKPESLGCKFFVDDCGGGCEAALITAPDFGCAQHKEKIASED